MELFIIRVKFAIYCFLHFSTVHEVAARLRAKSAIYDCLVVVVFMQIRDFTVKLNNYITSSVVYFKSQWSEIRSNAATLVGQY